MTLNRIFITYKKKKMGAIQVHEVYIASTDKNKREQEAKIETLRHKPSGNSRN